MKTKDIMSKKLVSVQTDDNLWLVKDLFEQTGFHHLLVIDDKNLSGVISDRDFFKAISPSIDTVAETAKDTATLNQKARQIMSGNVTTLTPDADVYDAIHIFNNHKISCIPIVNQDGEPVGIVSWRDIMRAVEMTRKKPGN